MKLIEAIIIAQREYGIYGDWMATHADRCFLGRGPFGNMYFAYLNQDTLITQSQRLEIVLAGMANVGSHRMYDEKWKVSRWNVEKCKP